jgi:hypothetical protein
MLVDSGNLVNDLISEEFAKQIRIKYTPVERKVGTAAKGGSVKIIGRSDPIRIFIENIPHAVVITPYVVRDLSHPINVGRDFLGRHEGRLEFSPREGYLELKGSKVKLIRKGAILNDPTVTDLRLIRAFQNTSRSQEKSTGMVFEGLLNSCESSEPEPIQMFSRQEIEVPANSAVFVSVTTNGKMPMKTAYANDLLLEPDVNGELPVLIVPGISHVIEGAVYCLAVNPEMKRIKIPEGTALGTIEVASINEVTESTGAKKASKNVIPQILKDLKLDENEIISQDLSLKSTIVQLFVKYRDIISRDEFDYRHTTALQCQIQLKPGDETPAKLKARPLNPAQEASMKIQLEEWEQGGIISPWLVLKRRIRQSYGGV